MISDKLVLLFWVQQLDKEGILPVHNFQRLLVGCAQIPFCYDFEGPDQSPEHVDECFDFEAQLQTSREKRTHLHLIGTS